MHFSSSAMNGFRSRVPLSVGHRPFPRFCRVGRVLVCNSGSEEPGVIVKPTRPKGPVLPISGYRSTPAAEEIQTLDVTEASEDIGGVLGSAGKEGGNGTTNGTVRENGNGGESEASEENKSPEYEYATLTRSVGTPVTAEGISPLSAPKPSRGLQRPERRERGSSGDVSQQAVGGDGTLSGRSSDDEGRTLSLIEELNKVSDENLPGDEEENSGSSLVQELNEMFDKTALHKGDELPFKGREFRGSSWPRDGSGGVRRPKPGKLQGGPSQPSFLRGRDNPGLLPLEDTKAEFKRPAPAKPNSPVATPASRPRPAAPSAESTPGSASTSPLEGPAKPVQPKSGPVNPAAPPTPPKPTQSEAAVGSAPPSPPSLESADVQEASIPSSSAPSPPVADPTLQSVTSLEVPSPVETPKQPPARPSRPSPKATIPAVKTLRSTPGRVGPISRANPQEATVPGDVGKQVENPPPPKLSVAPPPRPRARPTAPPPRFTPKVHGTSPPVVDKKGPRPGPIAKATEAGSKGAATPPKEAAPLKPVSPNLAKGPVQSPSSKAIPGVLERLRKKRVNKERRSRPEKSGEVKQNRGPGPAQGQGAAPNGRGDRRQNPGGRQTPAGAGGQKRRKAREGQFGGTSAENRRKARQQRQERRQSRAVTQEREEIIEVGAEGMLVSELAGKLLETPADIIKTLFMKGIMVTMTQTLDMDTVKVIGLEYGVEVLEKGEVELADMAKKDVEFIDEEDIENLVLRPPVVTVMGHVDHGKTSLLDYIRNASVAEGEAGGITQAIGAYQCEINVDNEDKTICFLDTPGHEAFSAMRARGAKVTDVAVIIVAADDGLQPQTREAVSHAKAADVPIIVAINKIDKDGANPERIKQQIGELELIPEEWGGKTPVIPISAKTGEGIDALLEVIVLMSEVELELMANPDRSARGTVVEADLDKRAGPVATMLVQNGTLKVGDIVVSGASFGKVRSLTSDRGVGSDEAGPSTAVRMLGLDSVPTAGDEFQVCETESEARDIAQKAAERIRQAHLAEVSGGGSMVTLSSLASMDDEVEGIQRLNIVLRADTSGAVEAVKGALAQLPQDSVMLRYLHSATGDITESDITLASPADGVILGFNVEPSEATMTSAKQKGVEIRSYKVIYDLIDDIRAAMEGRIKSVDEKVPIGTAEVRAVFGTGSRAVAGCMVTDGRLESGAVIEVKRKKKKIVFEGKLTSLRRVKDVVKTVDAGLECGVGCDFVDWEEGDIIEAYTLVAKNLTLEEASAPTAITLEELELELAESNTEK